LQPELLADAVQPGGEGQHQRTETYNAGDVAAALSISGRQNLASRRPGGSQLQRPLYGTGSLPTINGSVEGNYGRQERIRAGAGGAPALLNTRVHKNLCTTNPVRPTSYQRRARLNAE